MKEVIMYQCEICKATYPEKTIAIDCESEGTELPLLKIGSEIHEIIRMSGGWSDQHRPVKLFEIEDRGHYILYKFARWDDDENEWCEDDYIHAYGNGDLMDSFLLNRKED